MVLHHAQTYRMASSTYLLISRPGPPNVLHPDAFLNSKNLQMRTRTGGLVTLRSCTTSAVLSSISRIRIRSLAGMGIPSLLLTKLRNDETEGTVRTILLFWVHVNYSRVFSGFRPHPTGASGSSRRVRARRGSLWSRGSARCPCTSSPRCRPRRSGRWSRVRTRGEWGSAWR